MQRDEEIRWGGRVVMTRSLSMWNRTVVTGAFVVTLGWIAVRGGSHTVPQAPIARPPVPAFDVTKLMHDAHFAFRVDPSSRQLEGGDLHYRVLVDERGATLRA